MPKVECPNFPFRTDTGLKEESIKAGNIPDIKALAITKPNIKIQKMGSDTKLSERGNPAISLNTGRISKIIPKAPPAAMRLITNDSTIN